MTRLVRTLLALLLTSLAVAPTSLAAQQPDATVVLRAQDFTQTSLPFSVDRLRTGADFGWVCVASMFSAPEKVIFGDLTPGGVAGGQQLRVPQTIGGYAQTYLNAASTASGRIAYLESPIASTGRGRTAWVDDKLVASRGDAIGSTGLTWREFLDIQHLPDGSTYLRGTVRSGGVNQTAVVRYPGATVLIRTGDVLPGLTDPIIDVETFEIDAAGMHWIARVTHGTDPILPPQAFVADGAVFEAAPGFPVIELAPVPPAIAPAGSTFGRVFSSEIGAFGDVVFTAYVVDPTSTSSGLVTIREGRRVLPADPMTSGSYVEAVDPRGFAVSLESGVSIVVDGDPVLTSNALVDVDADGATDPGWMIRTWISRPKSGVSADGRQLYWIAQLRGPGAQSQLGVVRAERYGVAQPTCASHPNSSGGAAHIAATGSNNISRNEMVLQCIELPTTTVGIFLASATPGFSANPGGSQGDLCLGGSIGRYSSTPFFTMGTGRAVMPIDLTAIPQPTGSVTAMPGSTWFFQAWFRDAVGGAATSNFSDAVAVPLF